VNWPSVRVFRWTLLARESILPLIRITGRRQPFNSLHVFAFVLALSPSPLRVCCYYYFCARMHLQPTRQHAVVSGGGSYEPYGHIQLLKQQEEEDRRQKEMIAQQLIQEEEAAKRAAEKKKKKKKKKAQVG